MTVFDVDSVYFYVVSESYDNAVFVVNVKREGVVVEVLVEERLIHSTVRDDEGAAAVNELVIRISPIWYVESRESGSFAI
jgi:hypothetical protein